MKGAAIPLIRAIIEDVPTARCLTGVWNSSATYTNIAVKVTVIAPFPRVDNAVRADVRSENATQLLHFLFEISCIEFTVVVHILRFINKP